MVSKTSNLVSLLQSLLLLVLFVSSQVDFTDARFRIPLGFSEARRYQQLPSLPISRPCMPPPPRRSPIPPILPHPSRSPHGPGP